jgi:hypothetical protein
VRVFSAGAPRTSMRCVRIDLNSDDQLTARPHELSPNASRGGL